MFRMIVTGLCAALASSCASMPDWVIAPSGRGPGVQAELGHYRFNWLLAGERQVAPLQVFDNGRKTWLQFLPGQPVPAVFQDTPEGERPLTFERQGEYLVIEGVWPVLSFRGGTLRASARKHADDDAGRPSGGDVLTFPLSTPASADQGDIEEQADDATGDQQPGEHGLLPRADGPEELRDSAMAGAAADVADSVMPDIAAVSERAAIMPAAQTHSAAIHRGVPGMTYDIRLQDQNLRQALRRWARQADWVFAPEHWGVAVDIPVSAEAVFDGAFPDAVQELLAATELTEHPLRPCFYSNRVLRVLSYAQSCDRTTGARES